jgi:hypothetical protein
MKLVLAELTDARKCRHSGICLVLEIASSKFAASAIAARIGAVRRQGDVSVSMALIPSADPAEKSSGAVVLAECFPIFSLVCDHGHAPF